MKVILTAFDGLMKSDVMEWPELPPDGTLYFPLRQVRSNVGLTFKDIGANFEFVDLRATFKTTGKTFEQDDGSVAVELELVNVNPKYWEDGGVEERRNFRMASMVELILAKELAEKSQK